MGHYCHSLAVDATINIIASKNCHVGIVFVTQSVTKATLGAKNTPNIALRSFPSIALRIPTALKVVL